MMQRNAMQMQQPVSQSPCPVECVCVVVCLVSFVSCCWSCVLCTQWDCEAADDDVQRQQVEQETMAQLG